MFPTTVSITQALVLFTPLLGVAMVATEAEAEWAVVRDTAASVGATGIILARVVTLAIEATVGERAVSVCATTDHTDTSTA